MRKWKQSGPLIEHETLRGIVRRSRLIKHGIEAFDEVEENFGSENKLEEV